MYKHYIYIYIKEFSNLKSSADFAEATKGMAIDEWLSERDKWGNDNFTTTTTTTTTTNHNNTSNAHNINTTNNNDIII